MKLDKKLSLMEFLEIEKNFITKNSLLIMIMVSFFIIWGLYFIEIPVYKKITMKKINNNQLTFKEYDSVFYSTIRNCDTLRIVNKDKTKFLLLRLQDSLNKKPCFRIIGDQKKMTEGYFFEVKINIGRENLIISIIKDIFN